MRVLVTSDTHKNFDALKSVVERHPEAQVLIHLGDGASDAEKISEHFDNIRVIQVRGNCDAKSKVMLEKEVVLENVKIFMTHGHLFNVKQQIYQIYLEAKSREADVLLFGHTHQPLNTSNENLHIINPGSLQGSNGSYGILDITPSGIVTRIVYPFRSSEY